MGCLIWEQQCGCELTLAGVSLWNEELGVSSKLGDHVPEVSHRNSRTGERQAALWPGISGKHHSSV